MGSQTLENPQNDGTSTHLVPTPNNVSLSEPTSKPALRVRRNSEKRQRNRIAHRIAHLLPDAIKPYYLEKYQDKFENAVEKLLDGAPAHCAECGKSCGHYDRPPSHQIARAYLEMAGCLNVAPKIEILYASLGVRDETELRRRMELSKPGALTHEQYRDEAVELLKMLLQEHPEWRSKVMEKLGSVAVEVNGNGVAA